MSAQRNGISQGWWMQQRRLDGWMLWQLSLSHSLPCRALQQQHAPTCLHGASRASTKDTTALQHFSVQPLQRKGPNLKTHRLSPRPPAHVLCRWLWQAGQTLWSAVARQDLISRWAGLRLGLEGGR